MGDCMTYNFKNINDFDSESVDEFYNEIYPSKKKRIAKYRKRERYLSAVAGEILLAELLEDVYKIDYCSLEFRTNMYGKPYLESKDIYFNISHSYDMVIVAVADKEIGVDIEKIRDTSYETVNIFATEKEQRYIFSAKNNTLKRLFEIYTLKEAYFKCLGTNLDNLKSVEFQINNGQVFCSDNKVEVRLLNNIEGYVGAIVLKK